MSAPLVAEVSMGGLAVGFLMGGADTYPLVGGADSNPSGWVGLSLWMGLEATVCLRGLEVACLVRDGAVTPPGLLFALGLLRLTDGWGQIFPKWPPPEKGMLLNSTKSFFSNVLPP